MALGSQPHTHSDSWASTMDWIDLRNHLVHAHGHDADELDDLSRFSDDAASRRAYADRQHQALHNQAPNGSPFQRKDT